MNASIKRLFTLFVLAQVGFAAASGAETLLPLPDGKSPETVAAMWAGYDPTREPLEIEIAKEWEEDGVVLRAVRYCIGTFKGKKSWMGAYYGFPKGGRDLPGLVQVHGGGGAASKDECLDNARRGYATLSLNWRADDRYITKGHLPASAQTDWGAVDGSQSREARGIEPDNDKKYDPVPSGRNEGYFLRTLAARRALTFLERQPEVDGNRLGIYGHSMGGVITIETAAIDPRVKVAVPSCAPPIDRDDSLVARTGNAAGYVGLLTCPVLFLSPANDFHGQIRDIEWILDHLPSREWRLARSEHLNHKHNNSSLAAMYLWLDAHLKNSFVYPESPKIAMDLKTKDGRPLVTITPDASRTVEFVDVFYSRDAKFSVYPDMERRVWKFAKALQADGGYVAHLDLFGLEEPLWVYANVHYKLDQAPDSYRFPKPADTLTVSSRLIVKTGGELQAAGAKATLKPTNIIESFGDDWEKEWIFPRGGTWPMESWKLNDQQVPMPANGKLVLELASEKPNRLKVRVGAYSGDFALQGGNVPEVIEVYPLGDAQNKTEGTAADKKGSSRLNLVLGPSGGKWNGAPPEFRSIHWEKGPAGAAE